MLALVAAESREFAGVLRHVEGTTRLDWPVDFARGANLHGQPVVLVANGPGPKLAAQAAEVAKARKELKGLASIGFCGALDPSLEANDIFVAVEVNVSHALSLPQSGKPHKTGRLASLDRVVSTAAEKSQLYKTGAQAVEMEAAALAERAAEWHIPCYAIRVVTDTATESFPLDFNRMRDRDGRFSRARILAAAIRKPTVIPGLLKLDQRCKAAALALGDFLADTRF